nr:translation initiation factor IF-2 [Oryctolagus cuniculus]
MLVLPTTDSEPLGPDRQHSRAQALPSPHVCAHPGSSTPHTQDNPPCPGPPAPSRAWGVRGQAPGLPPPVALHSRSLTAAPSSRKLFAPGHMLVQQVPGPWGLCPQGPGQPCPRGAGRVVCVNTGTSRGRRAHQQGAWAERGAGHTCPRTRGMQTRRQAARAAAGGPAPSEVRLPRARPCPAREESAAAQAVCVRPHSRAHGPVGREGPVPSFSPWHSWEPSKARPLRAPAPVPPLVPSHTDPAGGALGPPADGGAEARGHAAFPRGRSKSFLSNQSDSVFDGSFLVLQEVPLLSELQDSEICCPVPTPQTAAAHCCPWFLL